MNNPDPNLVASVRSRLENRARTGGQNFEDILYRYAIERFLYRLSQSPYRDRFILKGAQVVAAWGVPLSRPSRDIDLRGYTQNTVEHLEQIVRVICNQPVEPDGMVFDPDSVIGDEIAEEAEYAGVRIMFWGKLGRARARMQVDVGFSDPIIPADIQVFFPTILEMPVPVLRGYPPETVISEKLQATVFHGEINSRMKDYYDIWLLSRMFHFEGKIIQRAISVTFENRDTVLPGEVPPALSDSFAILRQSMWSSGFLRKLPFVHEELIDFQKVISQLRIFLLPPLLAASRKEEFDMVWSPEGNEWKER